MIFENLKKLKNEEFYRYFGRLKNAYKVYFFERKISLIVGIIIPYYF
ncbi:hypothetical protein [Spiroplasma endosymbiont of Colias croceus]